MPDLIYVLSVIAPGLHGIIGDGIADDAPAINVYLNSLCVNRRDVLYNTNQLTGGRVFVEPGQYRLASSIIVPNTMTIVGPGSNSPCSGCQFIADPGVTAFVITNAANSTKITDLVITAAGKTPLPNTHGALDHDPGNAVTTGGAGSFAIALSNSCDASLYKNGDVVRIEGASLVHCPIWNLQVQTHGGSATADYNNPDGNLYCGLYEGQWISIAGAWNTRTRIISVDYVGRHFTMATVAAADVHVGAVGEAKVSFYSDAICRIQSGGGTVNLVIEDDSLQPAMSTYVHHFDCAIYASTEVHLEHLWIYGFKGAGLVHLGSGAFSPAGFDEFSTVLGVDFFRCGQGFYGKGVDSNSTTYTNMSANFIDMVGFYTEQHIGVTFEHPVTQGAYLGFVGGSTSNQSIIVVNPYSEGTTNAFGAGLHRYGGNGPYWGEALGLLSDGTIINGSDAAGTPGLISAGSVSPPARGVGNLGVTGGEWGQIWGQSYGGRVHDISAHGNVTIPVNGGETIRFTGDGVAISSMTLAAGIRGQMLSLIVAQDAGGTTTWPSTIGNAKLINGSWIKTMIANAEDNLLFRCDGVVWRQMCPTATNLS